MVNAQTEIQEQLHILIVDDTPNNLDVLVEHLEELGYCTAVALDGEEGIERAEYSTPDLILLDIMMPGMDGYETCRRLKQGNTTHAIPIIFMSALDGSDDIVKGFEAGAVDYITKPFDIIEVDARIQTQLNLSRLQSRLESSIRQLEQEISSRKQAEDDLKLAYQRLGESEERYRMLVEQSPEAILIEVENKITYANQAAVTLFGAEHEAQLLTHALNQFLQSVPGQLDSSSPHHEVLEKEHQIRCFSGKHKHVSITKVPFMSQHAEGTQYIVSDISARKHLEVELHYQATHDALTHLANRQLFMDTLQYALNQAKRNHHPVSLCFIDLDQFKVINDELGHEAGDQLLIAVAERLQLSVRATDTVARLGGDEFVVLLPESGQRQEIHQVLQRITQQIQHPVLLNGQYCQVTCSIGCARYPQNGLTGSELLQKADAAMYLAKQAGRNRIQYSSDEIKSESHNNPTE